MNCYTEQQTDYIKTAHC